MVREHVGAVSACTKAADARMPQRTSELLTGGWADTRGFGADAAYLSQLVGSDESRRAFPAARPRIESPCGVRTKPLARRTLRVSLARSAG